MQGLKLVHFFVFSFISSKFEQCSKIGSTSEISKLIWYFIRFALSLQANMNYESLVGRINLIQDALQAQAAHAVNLSLTARNWLVGYYIVEFEQHGEDRAKYGEKLLSRLSESLNQRGFNLRRLRDYRHVYQVYPYLGVEIVKFLESNGMLLPEDGRFSIRLFSTAEFQKSTDMHEIIRLSKTAELEEWSRRAFAESLC